MTMSRRFFMGSGVAGGVALATGLNFTQPALAGEKYPGEASGREDAFIAETAQSLERFVNEQPRARGLGDAQKFIDGTYPARPGSGTEDDALLQGALYLEAQRILELRAAPPSPEELARGLSAPLNVDKLNPEYFQTLLARTKERVASDAEYARKVSQAADQAFRLTINCNKHPILCGIIVVVVIVIILL